MNILMNTIVKIIILLILIVGNTLPQNFNSQQFYHSYDRFKEKNITTKLLKHSDLVKKIKTLKESKLFKVEIAGKSVENRNIYKLSIGKGKTHVLIWSQMHGDESTATMALLDLFNFFIANDELNKFREGILNKLTIHFIPMLNPDGAEVFKRRNAVDIDLNRDALRLEFPESRILKSVRDSLKPKFAFNLHDQNSRYSSGISPNSATISFLAPAYNYAKDINDTRANTMKVIVNIYDELQRYIPGHIAKYKDDFEPRAFGDNFVKWGTSSVLIESGGWKNDTDKQFIRKLNYVSLITGLHSIAYGEYKKADLKVYNNIPFNDNLIFDLLIRNVKVAYKNKSYKVDIGINREEQVTSDGSQIYYKSTIVDWGDLSIFYGYDDYDLDGYVIKESKIEYIPLSKVNEIDINGLIRKGVGFIKIDSLQIKREYSALPFNIITSKNNIDQRPQYNGYANFTIWKNKKLKYNVINGFIYDINHEYINPSKGLIF